jgi:Fur family transcriptional regulator, ferric uptake regulator
MTRKKRTEIEVEAASDDLTAENRELSTRFLRERENKLDRQTLRLAQALISAGFKVTEPRLAIIQEIVEFNGEFQIVELVNNLKKHQKQGEDIQLGTASIFRTVKLLTELGLVQRVNTGDSCHKYALVRGHIHQVICRCCTRRVDFQGCDFDELTNFLEKQTGFRLEGHKIEFFGLCDECNRAVVPLPEQTNLLPFAPLAQHQHSHGHDGHKHDHEPVMTLNVRDVSQIP